jgi:hypothetical protein
MDSKLFKDLKKALQLVYKGDDLIDQEDLFDLQELLTITILENSTPYQQSVLATEFSHLYSRK